MKRKKTRLPDTASQMPLIGIDEILTRNLTGIRTQIVDYTLIFSSILGALLYGLSLYKLLEGEFKISHITDFISILAIGLVAIFRSRIRLQIKALVILIGIFTLMFVDMLQLGLLSANKVLLVLIPFVSLTVFNLRQTIWIFSIAVGGMLLVGILTVSGHNHMLHEIERQIITPFPWLINIFILVIVALVIMYVTYRFNSTYERIFHELDSRNELIAERERNYREIFNSSSDAIFILDSNGRIIDVNEAVMKIFSLPNPLPDFFPELFISKKEEPAMNLAALFMKPLPAEFFLEVEHRKLDTSLAWMDLMLKPVTIGGAQRTMVIARDITEKKRIALQIEAYKNHLEELVKSRTQDLSDANDELQSTNESLSMQKEKLSSALEELRKMQKQLIQNEKMASIGILTAGIAHEINNPLNFIQSGVFGIDNFLSDAIGAEEFYNHRADMKAILDLISIGVQRVAKIVSGLNHFNRQSSSFSETCNLHEIIDNCFVVLQHKMNSEITILRNYSEKPFVISGNEGQLHQAFLNIILNAVQSIGPEGSIAVTTELDGKSVKVKIEDTGSGIPEDVLPRIFDPFFTTKGVGEGTGLGLSITYGIILDHGGEINYSSQTGKGTIVTVVLPVGAA